MMTAEPRGCHSKPRSCGNLLSKLGMCFELRTQDCSGQMLVAIKMSRDSDHTNIMNLGSQPQHVDTLIGEADALPKCDSKVSHGH